MNDIGHKPFFQALAAVLGLGIIAVAVILAGLPADAPLCAALTAATALWGYTGGAAGGAVLVAAALYLYSGDLGHLAVLVICAAAIVATVCVLRRRWSQTRAQLDEALRAGDREPSEALESDALTGIRSRGAIRLDYSRFENRFVHVMTLDLDDYRRMNDTYGHAVGDYLLKKVGTALTEAFGAGACYRYGGDEFLVLCEDLDATAFSARVRRLKDSLGNITLDDKRLPVRFSAGGVYGTCAQSSDLRLMMRQSRQNLETVRARGGDDFLDTSYAGGVR